jgi:asparagine synthase (glutamine-hydrolysing)
VGCYLRRKDRVVFLFDDVGLAKALGLITGEPDPAGVVQSLAYPHPRDTRTGLVGVEEVLPGTAIAVSPNGQVTRAYAWTPGRFTLSRLQFSDAGAAAKAVRAQTQRGVSAWAKDHRSIVLELSGGLDSSIVAACLSDRADDLHLVTLVTPDPGADERDYAQAVAQGVGAPLRVLNLDVAKSRLEPQQLLTARPRGGLLHRLIDGVLTSYAEEVSADGFFSGGGGDNVF